MGRIIDLTGHTYHRLTVLAPVGRRHGRIAWLCRCECGSLVPVTSNDLRKGHTRSCGCLLQEAITTHGKSPKNKQADPEDRAAYTAWIQAKNRCYNPKNPRYHRYGGRGIEMCEEWRNSFEAFYADVGRRPGPEYSIGRIKNDKNYEPGNVRWETDEEQYRSRSTTIEIQVGPFKKSIAELSKIVEIPAHIIRNRIFKLGWSVSDAITKPVGKTGPKKRHPSQ